MLMLLTAVLDSQGPSMGRIMPSSLKAILASHRPSQLWPKRFSRPRSSSSLRPWKTRCSRHPTWLRPSGHSNTIQMLTRARNCTKILVREASKILSRHKWTWTSLRDRSSGLRVSLLSSSSLSTRTFALPSRLKS